MRQLWLDLGVPVVAIAAFLLVWSQVSQGIQTSLGQIPGPAAVWEQTKALWADHLVQREKAAAFYERQEKRNAEKLAEDPAADMTVRKYTGKPTYIDQIFTSLKTVFAGFLLATLARRAHRHPVRRQQDVQCDVQSADPVVQAGVAARLAADRHDDRERGVRDAPIRCSTSRSSTRRSR